MRLELLGVSVAGVDTLTPPCNTRMDEEPSALACVRFHRDLESGVVANPLQQWLLGRRTQEIKGKTTQNRRLRKVGKLNPLPQFYAESAHVGGSAQRLADREVLVPTSACSP